MHLFKETFLSDIFYFLHFSHPLDPNGRKAFLTSFNVTVTLFFYIDNQRPNFPTQALAKGQSNTVNSSQALRANAQSM